MPVFSSPVAVRVSTVGLELRCHSFAAFEVAGPFENTGDVGDVDGQPLWASSGRHAEFPRDAPANDSGKPVTKLDSNFARQRAASKMEFLQQRM